MYNGVAMKQCPLTSHKQYCVCCRLPNPSNKGTGRGDDSNITQFEETPTMNKRLQRLLLSLAMLIALMLALNPVSALIEEDRKEITESFNPKWSGDLR